VRERLRTAFALLFCSVFLTSCATGPRVVRDIVGQIPGISILVDLSDLSSLMERGMSDDVSEAELTQLEARPTPVPPGLSYEIGVLRKMAAALLRGNSQGVIERHRQLERNGRTEQMLKFSTVFATMAEAQRGNLQSALRYASHAERKWYAAARDARNAQQADANSELSFVTEHIGLALMSARPEVANRLLREYIEPPNAFSSASPFQRHVAHVNGRAARAALMLMEGNVRAAYDIVIEARSRHLTAMRRFRDLPDKDVFVATHLDAALLFYLVNYSTEGGELARATRHLDEMRALPLPRNRARSITSLIHSSEATFRMAIGDYPGALRSYQAAVASQPLLLRNSILVQHRDVLSLAPLTLLAGDAPGALNVLVSRGPLDQIQDGFDKDALIQWHAAIGAINNRFGDNLERLERIEPRYANLAPGRGKLLQYATKTYAYERRAVARGQQADYVRAVENGRQFSSTLRAVRTSAPSREQTYAPPLLAMVKEAYVRAASATVGRNGVTLADLVDAVSLLQTSELDDDVAAAASRQKRLPGVSAAQLRQLQDLQQAARGAQRVVGELSRSLDVDAAWLAALTNEANVTSERLTKFLLELQRTAPAVTQAFGGPVPSVADIQSRLGAQEGLVAFVPMPDQTLALLITKSGVEHRMLPLRGAETHALVKRIRNSVAFNDAGQVPPFDVEAAKALHSKLLGWAQRPLVSIKSLTVVSSGSLGSIPFGLLLDSTASGSDYRTMPWLIKSMAVTHMPTMASWYAVSSTSGPSRGSGFIAWADPDFSGEAHAAATNSRAVRKAVRSTDQRGLAEGHGQLPSNLGAMLPALPETKAEAQAIARALKAAQGDVVAGPQATRSSVLAMSDSGALAQRGVVMFATHGLAPAQVPGLFQPALALSREQGSRQPSLLQLDDVVGLRLNADWVLLSACNTAAADRVGGDAMSGLARGFFFAGARSLLVTHWEVESESAAAITTRTMERYAANTRLTRAQALQDTSVELIEAKNSPADWSHPAFWAGYALVGDGRRSAAVGR
jgi:CHAT domain-containing protein